MHTHCLGKLYLGTRTLRYRWVHLLVAMRKGMHQFFMALFQLYYTPDHLDTYVGIKYDQKVDPSKHDGIKADDVLSTISEYIPEGRAI